MNPKTHSLLFVLGTLITHYVPLQSSTQNQTIVFSNNSSSQYIQNKINQTINLNGILNEEFGGNSEGLSSVAKGTTFINSSISGQNTTPGDSLNAMALQADGKIIVGGYSSSYNDNGVGTPPCYFSLARFLPDGTLDVTFGVQTEFTQSLIPGTVFINGSITNYTAAPKDTITSLAIQSDGKIVATGYTYDNNNYVYFALARFLPNGTLDTTFGQTTAGTTSFIPGTVFLSGGICANTPNDLSGTVTLQSDGKIVIGGTISGNGEGKFFGFARFLTNGTLDSSFGKTTEHTTCFTPGSVYLSTSISGKTTGGINDAMNFSYTFAGPCIAIDQSENILGAGYTEDSTGSYFFAVARLTSDGELDSSFGNLTQNGVTSLFPGSMYISTGISGVNLNIRTAFDLVSGIALQNDNKIVLGGYSRNATSGEAFFAVARLLPNGILDDSFGATTATTQSNTPGTVYISSCISGPALPNQSSDWLRSIALQNDGHIIVTGQTWNTAQGDYRLFAVARFLPNGTLDTHFGATQPNTISHIPGTVYITKSLSGQPNNHTLDYPHSIAVLPNGNIVTVGLSWNNSAGISYFALAEFYNPSNFASYQKNYSSVGAGLNC